MSGRLIATLFLPYLIIAILGTIADDTFAASPDTAESMINEMYDVRMASGSQAGTASYTGASTVQKVKGGFNFLTDATGSIFGFTKNLFKVLTLNYSFWSSCQKSTDANPGYSSTGALLTSGSGSCFIDATGYVSEDAALGYMFVRYALLIMALPAIYVLTFKSAELMARFVSSLGSAIGGIVGFIPGLR